MYIFMVKESGDLFIAYSVYSYLGVYRNSESVFENKQQFIVATHPYERIGVAIERCDGKTMLVNGLFRDRVYCIGKL